MLLGADSSNLIVCEHLSCHQQCTSSAAACLLVYFHCFVSWSVASTAGHGFVDFILLLYICCDNCNCSYCKVTGSVHSSVCVI